MKRAAVLASLGVFALLCVLAATLPSTACVVSYPGLALIAGFLLYLNFHDHKDHREH